MIWSEYVRGRSVAVVGPAPLERDQSAEIDAHDVVYRTAQHLNAPPTYGTKLDVVFLNGQHGRQVYDDHHTWWREIADSATWWVFKDGRNTYRRDGLRHVAVRPRITNPNAVTCILFDLIQQPVGNITVFGADLYASGPGNAYHDGYDKRPVSGQAAGITMHKPMEQMRVHRAVHSTGKVTGDDRYLAAVTMSDDEYRAVIDRWRDAAEETPA